MCFNKEKRKKFFKVIFNINNMTLKNFFLFDFDDLGVGDKNHLRPQNFKISPKKFSCFRFQNLQNHFQICEFLVKDLKMYSRINKDMIYFEKLNLIINENL